MSVQNSNNLVNAGTQPALAITSNALPAIKGLAGLTMVRQVGLMLGLALSVAIGVAVVLWSQTPTYGLLFSEIGDKDASEILEVLESQGVEYKVESGSGTIMVQADKVHELKLKLASQGLPRSKSLGYDLLDKDQGFGTSKNVEALRFQRALEGEIAQTIMSIQNVKSARVLLAMPQQSVFVRERKKPSASVMINLYQGRALDKGQIESIVHLVSSSVPLLEADQVTVVDQKGRLLNSKDSSSEVYLASRQLEYKKNIEDHLMERIANILTPLVGSNGMRVQLSADVDFTQTEKTQEMFNPEVSVLRSEQTSEEKNSLSAVQGVPGALSNQPTPAGNAPETLTAGGADKNAANNGTGSSSKSATRNFELDKTITHTRMSTGAISRLTVAVVVDDRHNLGKDGTVTNQPYTMEQLGRFSDLVKQAVGFDNTRGDQVTVTNVAFNPQDEMENLPEVPVWKQSWFSDLMKQFIAVAMILLLLFGVLRPAVRGLIGRSADEKEAEEPAVAEAHNPSMTGADGSLSGKSVPAAVPADQNTAIQPLTAESEAFSLLTAPRNYEKSLEYVQKLVDENPKLVVQTIKAWIKDETKNDAASNGTERASLLLFALGQKRAAEIIKFLELREVELLGTHMMSLKDISPDMVEDVLHEFISTVRKQTALGVDSEEYIRSVLTNALDPEKAGAIIDRILIGGRCKGINQLKWMDTRAITDLVSEEHPQVVANILSLLEGQRAADVIMSLPEEVRPSLLMRIASLEGVPLAALRELDEMMEEQLEGNENIKSSFVGGINVAANILNHMDSPDSTQLLEEISSNSAELAQKIQDKMFIFEDLANLDDKGMQTLLREVPTDRLLLALRGVSEVLKNKIFNNLSRRAADILRDDLEAAPPAKLSEVELAQKEILIIVRTLADSGAIVFGGGDDKLI